MTPGQLRAAAAAASSKNLAEPITKEDLLGAEQTGGGKSLYNAKNNIVTKIAAAKADPRLEIDHNINAEQYPNVFILSDIHADYRKFIKLLSVSTHDAAPLINVNGNPVKDSDIEGAAIYNTDLITNVEFLPSNSLLIIVGDLIDGKRGDDQEVNDSKGSFEFLLHCFLYNLRLSALKRRSNVIFTLGNHDLHTVIINSGLEHYIASKSQEYFNSEGNNSKRASALKIFYTLSPYIFLNLNRSDKSTEVVCIHGGLHSNLNNNASAIPELNKIQTKVNTGGFQALTAADIAQLIRSEGNNGSPLWDRFYATDTSDKHCKAIENDKTAADLIVVGHCPTAGGMNPRAEYLINSNQVAYKSCGTEANEKGCVVADCFDAKGAPRLVFVDTMMSGAFYHSGSGIEMKRGNEILNLARGDKENGETRFYNVISRIAGNIHTIVAEDKKKKITLSPENELKKALANRARRNASADIQLGIASGR